MTCCVALFEAKFLDEIQTKVFLHFFKLTQPLTVSVKVKGGKPDRKLYPLHIEISSLRTLKIRPKNLNEIVRS